MNIITTRRSLRVALAALASSPLLAFAHGQLVSAVPAAGSTVNGSPAEVRLTFNEALEAAFSQIKVIDAKGQPVTRGKAQISASEPQVMHLALPTLAAGSYTVQWVVMTHDSHKTKSTYSFAVKQ